MSEPLGEVAPRVMSVQVGRIAPLGARGVPSGFVKSAVSGPVNVAPLGLHGDEQADLTVHGGPDKAVYFYPSEHYPSWLKDVPRHEHVLHAGAFGENITTLGLDEQTVAIGDVFRIGSAEFQATQPRQPCFKLGLRFNDNSLGRIMLQTGRTGWYVRVLTPGTLQAGDEIEVLRRPNPRWTIARFNGFIFNKKATKAEIVEVAGLEGLAEVWRTGLEESLSE
ncbi:MAG: MOSC domain-containing protein [Phycisphaeraceae bacterium]|nr:MOSC domain-containing protein [Phycisphaeraceae bacterium]